MKELSWHDRGRLWLRLGLRAALWALAVWFLVRMGPVLVSLFAPFLLALVMAWALSPAVSFLHRHFGMSRKFLSLALLLLVFGALGAGLWALVSAGASELGELAGSWEELMASLQGAADALGSAFSQVMARLPAAARETVEALAQRFFQWLETVLPRLLHAGMDSAAEIAKALPSFAVAAVVFLMASYFLIAGYPALRSGLADLLPPGPRRFASLVRKAASAGFGGYLKAELILSVGVFFILLGGFFLIHQPYALLLAAGLAVLDFVPILGSGTVMVPWMIVSFLSGDPRQGVGLGVVWGLVALFRRVAEPKVLGDQTGLSPFLSLVSVYVGMKLAGVAGMILAPVVCLVIQDVCRSGVLDNTLSDLRLAAGDIAALLRPGA